MRGRGRIGPLASDFETRRARIAPRAPWARAGSADAHHDEAIDDGPTACNQLINAARPIQGQKVPMTIPVPGGGLIADGTYYETAFTCTSVPGAPPVPKESPIK